MFPLTSQGCCSTAQVCHQSLKGTPWTYSKKLIILTAISAPLLDRIEVLEVSGYVSEENAVIASRYLGLQVKDASGLAEADIQLEPSAVDILIKYYCREWSTDIEETY